MKKNHAYTSKIFCSKINFFNLAFPKLPEVPSCIAETLIITTDPAALQMDLRLLKCFVRDIKRHLLPFALYFAIFNQNSYFNKLLLNSL